MRATDPWMVALCDRMMKRTAQKIVVAGLVAGGTLDDPCVEPWFHIVMFFSDSVRGMKYDVATKDGDSFHHLDFIITNVISPKVRNMGGSFSLENQFMVKEAIKRYVGELQI